MLLSLVICVYISFLCWMWGSMVIHLFNKIAGNNHSSFHFSITCLAGLAAITTIGGLLSLFMPLGGWIIQFLLLIPVVFYRTLQTLKKNDGPKNLFSGFHFSVIILFIASVLMILIIGSWKIVHPDTLGYHAQTIKWIEEYKAVPGLANLHPRFGYQGLWFVSSALFSYSFLVANAVSFINMAVLIWFVYFIAGKLNNYFTGKARSPKTLLWAGLLILSAWSYTQVRLTAASASPDFIAAILVWSVLYLLTKKTTQQDNSSLLILLLSFFAVTVKLSVVLILIISAFLVITFLLKRKYKLFFFSMALLLLTMTPFVTRNIVTSGYVIFPSPIPDVISTDWKYNRELTLLEKNYILAYARIPVEHTKAETNKVLAMGLSEWLPYWWKNRSVADKTIMLLMLFSLIIALFHYKNLLRLPASGKLAVFVSKSGVIFWFVQAPDPRFGFGFIIPLTALLIYHSFPKKNNFSISKKITVLLLLSFSVAVSAYSVYRLIRFFSPKQLIMPLGIEKTGYVTVKCNSTEYNIPQENKDCGKLPLPCMYENCKEIIPRGRKLSDGFRIKQSP